nr:EAL domain-containing protein [Desulfurispira natronophila]
MSGAIEGLPQERIVFDIQDHATVNSKLLKRIQELSYLGYQFALGNVTMDSDYLSRFRRLLEAVDYIKVDCSLNSETQLRRMTPHLKKFHATLIAEKVETHDDALLCQELGFAYFQGFYFHYPEVISGAVGDPGYQAVLKTLQIVNDADSRPEDIERELKRYPELCINLLRYINSGACPICNPIHSLGHAIRMVGRTRIASWLLLLSYARPSKGQFCLALLEVVILRALLVEEILRVTPGVSSKQREQGFFVGIVSLSDVIFSDTLESILEDMKVSSEIWDAVRHFSGPCGQALKLASIMERETTDNACSVAKSLGVELDVLEKIRLNAYAETHNMLDNLR